MTTAAPLSDCSIASLLPRTLGPFVSTGGATFETDDHNVVRNLFKSTALKNMSNLLENAKIISSTSSSINPNESSGDGNIISAERINDGQVELQDNRARQRRPGLPGVERGRNIFNFSAKTTAIEASQVGTSNLSKRRLSCAESNSVGDSQSWPVIDYSCLEKISDPIEYFSTYKMLENAEEEVKRLKRDASPRLSQPQGRRDRQRRPGLPDLDRQKNVFKFPGITATMEASPMQSSGLSNITELIITCSKENTESKNSDSGVSEIDELERIMSKCRELDNDELGIANILRDTLQINPVSVEKSGGVQLSVATDTEIDNHQIRLASPATKGNKIDGLSTLKGRLSMINRMGNPPFLHYSSGEKQTDASKELCSGAKKYCDDGIENLPRCERGNENDELENLTSNIIDHRVDWISTLEQVTLKTKPLDAKEMKNSVHHLSTLKKSVPLTDIQDRLDKISALKNHILQSTSDNLMFTHDDFGDPSLNEGQEVNTLSPVESIHLDGGYLETINASIPQFSNRKKSSFVDEVHPPVAQILEADKDICYGKTLSDSKVCQFSLPEKCQNSDGIICNKELVSDPNFEKPGHASSSIDLRASKSLANPSSDKFLSFVSPSTDNSGLYVFPSSSLVGGTINNPEQILHPEVPKEQCLPKNLTVMDEQMDAPNDVLNGKRKNRRKTKKKEPSSRRNKRNQIFRRESFGGAGTVWDAAGVRRSTRIRMKPLQYWCGERFLYGRVHDSLATVIGVKKFGTPESGKQPAMKVKSYVSEQYADLVAQAALH